MLKKAWILLLLALVISTGEIIASEISMHDTTAMYNQDMQIPVYTSDLTGFGVSSFDFEIQIDTTLLEYKGYSAQNSLSLPYLIVDNASEVSKIYISAAGSSTLNGGGVLLYLNFRTKEKAGIADVNIQNFVFSDSVPNPSVKSGSVTIDSPTSILSGQSDVLSIEDMTAYPNPFNGQVKILYTIPFRTHVEIDIVNILGQRVRILYAGEQQEGRYFTAWNGTSTGDIEVAPGIYLCRIKLGATYRYQRITYLK